MNLYLIVSSEGAMQVSGDSTAEALLFFFTQCVMNAAKCCVRAVIPLRLNYTPN
jgi:hypothetical protein